MERIKAYIIAKYGSICAFKLLKYVIEHKLARESNGYAGFEVIFKIAPSIVLTKYALTRLECIADDATKSDAEEGVRILISRGILRCDSETEVLELNVPLNSVANLRLVDTGTSLITVADPHSQADVILLPYLETKHEGITFTGVPDVICKGALIEIKLSTSWDLMLPSYDSSLTEILSLASSSTLVPRKRIQEPPIAGKVADI